MLERRTNRPRSELGRKPHHERFDVTPPNRHQRPISAQQALTALERPGRDIPGPVPPHLPGQERSPVLGQRHRLLLPRQIRATSESNLHLSQVAFGGGLRGEMLGRLWPARILPPPRPVDAAITPRRWF